MSITTSYFLGIDPSATSTGIVLLNDTERDSIATTIKPNKLRDIDRLKYINNAVTELLTNKDIKSIVMESPSYGSVHKEFILGEVLGCIKLAIGNCTSAKVYYAAPLQIKKFLTGNHRAGKPEMITEALLRGCPSLQNDVCDAWSAALLAKSIYLNKSVIDTRPAAEVLSAIIAKQS
jgi:Holliday junction resolvasome RuvABC endonuclease subunit